MKKNILILLLSIFCLIAYNNSALAAIYYVDFDAGSDSNNGTSTLTPWRTLPGTYGQTAWGSINSSNKIPVGSTIYIKAGTTHSSVDPKPGNIIINSTYYTAPTQESERITITVSSTWGSGDVTINGVGLSYGGLYSAYLFQINQISYITMKGISTAKLKLISAQTSSKYGLIIKGASSPHTTAVNLDYLWIEKCDHGLIASWTDNFIWDHITAYDNSSYGIMIGADDLNCNGGSLQNSESDTNGSLGTSNMGIGVFSSTNITIRNTSSHDCPARNWDAGFSNNNSTAPQTVTYINCTSYNGRDGGFCANGTVTGVDRVIYTYINCISYNDNNGNYVRGGFHFYDGCTAYLYHCIVDKRNMSSHFVGFSAVAEVGYGSVKIYAKNCVGYAPTTGSGERKMWYLIEQGAGDKVTLESDYNAYDQTGLSIFAMARSKGGSTLTYTFAQWKVLTAFGGAPDPHSITSTRIDYYWTDVANNNYTITSTLSPLNNAGTYLSAPPYVLTDKAGVIRSNPATIGPYEYSKEVLSAPSNLRIVPQ